jgi:protein tyrosine/serine phosphatase
MRPTLSVAFTAISMLACTGCATLVTPAPSSARQLEMVPAARIVQVDERLYRGGQPSAKQLRELAHSGVKTIISLRAYGHSARQQQVERRLAEELGMKWVSLPMRMYWRPSAKQVDAFLAIMDDPAQAPVYIHCQHGEDRTGAMVAVYRVRRQGWKPALAYAESLRLGLAAWNPFFRTLILHDRS